MRKLLPVLAISALLITGCTSPFKSKAEYDEVELIRYEACVRSVTDEITANGLINAIKDQTFEGLFKSIDALCEFLKPKKNND